MPFLGTFSSARSFFFSPILPGTSYELKAGRRLEDLQSLLSVI